MWFRTLLLAGSLAICAGAAPATARPHLLFAPDYVQPVEARGRQNILSVRDVAEILRQRNGGGQLNSARLEGGERPFYVVRWEMPNGDFRDFTVDAVTGQVR
jgi:uncharacterized membrane protein YkoI